VRPREQIDRLSGLPVASSQAEASRAHVLTGYNTDIEHDGVTYHVQTEDRGEANPLIESLVYVKGEILASRRTAYTNLLEAGAERQAIQNLMESQHRTIVDALRAGRLDLLTEPPVGAESDTTVTRRPPPPPPAPGSVESLKRSEKTLDEVIADWLAEQQHDERIRLRVVGGDDLTFGGPFALRAQIVTAPGGTPVAGAHAQARFLSTVMKPTQLAEGDSDSEGIIELQGEIPRLEKGQGLLVVTVRHERGNDEVKFLVKR